MPEEANLVPIAAFARALKRDPRDVRKIIDAGWFRPDASYQHGGETRPLVKGSAERLIEADTILSNQEACREWAASFESRPENLGWSVQDDQLGQLVSLRTRPFNAAKEERWRAYKREEPLIECLKKRGVFTR